MKLTENTIVNRETGEQNEDIQEYKRLYHNVDSTAFIKIYLEGMEKLADLNQAALGVLAAVFRLYRTETPMNRDLVYVSYNDLKISNHYDKSRRTFTKGMNTLIRNEFLAYSKFDNQFYINPNYFFNGNTIIFTREYVLSDSSEIHSINRKVEN